MKDNLNKFKSKYNSLISLYKESRSYKRLFEKSRQKTFVGKFDTSNIFHINFFKKMRSIFPEILLHSMDCRIDYHKSCCDLEISCIFREDSFFTKEKYLEVISIVTYYLSIISVEVDSVSFTSRHSIFGIDNNGEFSRTRYIDKYGDAILSNPKWRFSTPCELINVTEIANKYKFNLNEIQPHYVNKQKIFDKEVIHKCMEVNSKIHICSVNYFLPRYDENELSKARVHIHVKPIDSYSIKYDDILSLKEMASNHFDLIDFEYVSIIDDEGEYLISEGKIEKWKFKNNFSITDDI